MHKDDLIKRGRAAALPNGAEAGLVSHVTVRKRYRSFIASLLVSGKREAMTDAIFGRVPGVWEEEEEDELLRVGQ